MNLHIKSRKMWNYFFWARTLTTFFSQQMFRQIFCGQKSLLKIFMTIKLGKWILWKYGLLITMRLAELKLLFHAHLYIYVLLKSIPK